MADKTMGGPSKGKSHGGDQTAQPGAAAGKIPFGIQNPLNTGAPGSNGGGGAPSDPTVQVPVPTSVFGSKTDVVHTGAPGGSGAHGSSATGASYTQDSYGWSPRIDQTGGSVDTEAQGNKYGSDTGIPGLKTPKGTGAQASPGPGYGSSPSVTDGSERI
jgi:hypothetical protein